METNTVAIMQMDQAQAWIDYLLKLGPELFTVIVFIVFGYVLRFMNVPGKFIPSAVVICSTAFYCFIVGNQLAPHWVSNPIPWKCGIGFILGFASWLLHNRVLNKYIDPYLNIGGGKESKQVKDA